MKISVIFSTYNATTWLEKVLWGFEYQTDTHFEVIIADDGSTSETKHMINNLRQRVSFKIKHVWQPDEGFQKTRILNKALVMSTGDYIIFTDGDCIPRYDFVATHRSHAQENYFLSGGYFKLPMSTSHHITPAHIRTRKAFDKAWLIKNGVPKSYKLLKLSVTKPWDKLLNRLTPTKATWNGHNASGWRRDIFSANGFDERMQYGGEDRELGERLINSGIKSKQLRYSAICMHLDHARGYVSQQMLETNAKIREETQKSKLIKTRYGIHKGGE